MSRLADRSSEQVHDFDARSPDELTLRKGDTVEVLEDDGEFKLWRGCAMRWLGCQVGLHDGDGRLTESSPIPTDEFGDGWYLVSSPLLFVQPSLCSFPHAMSSHRKSSSKKDPKAARGAPCAPCIVPGMRVVSFVLHSK